MDFYKCELCALNFEMDSMLLRHKLKYHRNENGRRKISFFLKKIIDEETLYSSDSDCDYRIVTTVLRIPRVKLENLESLPNIDKSEIYLKANQKHPFSVKLENSDEDHNSNGEYDGTRYPCDLCDKTFLHKNSIYKHKRSIHKNDLSYIETNSMDIDDKNKKLNGNCKTTDDDLINNESTVTCKECNQHFKSRNSIYKHMKLKHNQYWKITGLIEQDLNEEFSCHFCAKSVNSKKLIYKHLKTVHRKELFLPELLTNSYKCNICNKIFHRLKWYNEHQKKHTEKTKPSKKNIYLCNFCGKKYPHSNHLKVHLRVHTGERPFICSICNKGFCIKKTWQDHMFIHSGEKRYKCPVEGCDKSFTHASGSRQHYICMHAKIKRFQCAYCDKLCSTKIHLLEHVRIHTGERPHECKLCGSKFKLASTLRIHTRTHTGERPFTCDICNKGFIKSSGLKQHQKSKRSCSASTVPPPDQQ